MDIGSCPFCGYKQCAYVSDIPGMTYVYCGCCGASGPNVCGGFINGDNFIETAIEQWNNKEIKYLVYGKPQIIYADNEDEAMCRYDEEYVIGCEVIE